MREYIIVGQGTTPEGAWTQFMDGFARYRDKAEIAHWRSLPKQSFVKDLSGTPPFYRVVSRVLFRGIDWETQVDESEKIRYKGNYPWQNKKASS